FQQQRKMRHPSGGGQGFIQHRPLPLDPEIANAADAIHSTFNFRPRREFFREFFGGPLAAPFAKRALKSLTCADNFSTRSSRRCSRWRTASMIVSMSSRE